jgi:Cd2+/Zn2+-exporting ATPase
MLAGIAQAARRGVLIKGGVHLEALAQLRAVAFDKTGTLTIGRPEVTDLVPMAGVSAVELLTIAAAVERRSQHPLAQAVVRRALRDGLELPPAGDLVAVTARGVRSEVGGQPVLIGSRRLWERGDDAPPAELLTAMDEIGSRARSVMAVRHGSRWLGVIGLADPPRESVPRALAALRAMGLGPLVMLTGDHQGVGDAVGREVGIDLVRADLLPEQKVVAVRELLAAHGAGTAAALETADIALMGDDLVRLPFAIGLARRARALLWQNLIIAGGVMAALLVLAALGVLRIGPAVVGHEGSTLVVIANALRLLAHEDG